MSWIVTATNKKHDVFSLNVSDYCIEDIAWGLAAKGRFSGQIKQMYPISRHCINVSYCVPQAYALEALLHDASEWVLGDMPRPVKHEFEDFQQLENFTDQNIRYKYNLPIGKCTNIVKHWDYTALITEAQFFGFDTSDWAKDLQAFKYCKKYAKLLEPWKRRDYYHVEREVSAFLKRFTELH